MVEEARKENPFKEPIKDLLDQYTDITDKNQTGEGAMMDRLEE